MISWLFILFNSGVWVVTAHLRMVALQNGGSNITPLRGPSAFITL
jgi:hypothetical protein